MKKLTNVYIYVDKINHKKASELLQSEHLPYGCIYFNFDNIKSWSIRERDAKKITLTELKRLIDTIPTRDEIKRLKQQISAYKMNLSLVNERCKELQSYNESLKHRLIKLRELNDVIYKDVNRLTKENAQLKQRKFWQIWK